MRSRKEFLFFVGFFVLFLLSMDFFFSGLLCYIYRTSMFPGNKGNSNLFIQSMTSKVLAASGCYHSREARDVV